MGAVGDDDSEYIQIMNAILEEFENRLTLEELVEEVSKSHLNPNDLRTAQNRIRILRRFCSERRERCRASQARALHLRRLA
ncbi:MAG: hypothetical protein QM757_44025 [Paludibaculum sp.]